MCLNWTQGTRFQSLLFLCNSHKHLRVCFAHWLFLEFSPDILSSIPVPDQWHTHTHTEATLHAAQTHSNAALDYTHSLASTVTSTVRLIWGATQKRVREKPRERERRDKLRRPAPGCHGYADVSCVSVWEMEVGESETTKGRCEIYIFKKWRRRSKHGAWPEEENIEAAVVIVAQNKHTKSHHRFQRSAFCLPGSKIFTLPLSSAVKLMPCLSLLILQIYTFKR